MSPEPSRLPPPRGDRIRLATAADGAALAAIYAPAVLQHAISFELVAPDADEMARRVLAVQQRTPWLVWERAGEVLGYAYAGGHRERAAYQWSVEVSAYVAASAHRTGIARRLYAALFAVLAAQGFQSAYAGITLPNPASEGLHKAMGFVLVGVYHAVGFKHGRWRDVAWYERAIGSRPSDPAPPIALPALSATPRFGAILEAQQPGRAAAEAGAAAVRPD
jgi:L-amino acid N-acyltransferase YncA